MLKVLEDRLCKINYSESLYDLAQETLTLLHSKIDEYKIFFDISVDEQIVVNYFDDMEEFRELMFDFDVIKQIGNNVLQNMFNYYDEKIVISNKK